MNWMHSCRRVAELLSQARDEPLGLFDRARLRLHLSMCDDCSQVERQFETLHTLSADLFADEHDVVPAGHAPPPPQHG